MNNLPALTPQLSAVIQAARSHLIAAAGLSAAINLLALAPTIYMLQAYDRALPTSSTATLLTLTIALAIALATQAGLDAMRGRILARCGLRSERTLVRPVLRCLMQGEGSRSGTNSRLMRDFDRLRETIGGQPLITLFDLPWTPIYLIVAFMLHPLLALAIAIGVAALLVVTLLSERQNQGPLRLSADHAARWHAHQEKFVRQSELIRALGMRQTLVSQLAETREHGRSLAARAQIGAASYTAIAKFLRILLQSLALGLGVWLAIRGELSAGAIIAASVLLARALQPVEQLVGALPALAHARQTIALLGELFEGASAAEPARTQLPVPTGRVEVRNLMVRHPQARRPLLHSVSFDVVPGEILIVTGPSGAGKSLLIRVLSGGLAFHGGSYRLDGASIRDWDSDRLGRHIGYMPQSNAMLPGSVADNISRFALRTPERKQEVDHAIIEAAVRAGVHETVLSLENGYDTMLDPDRPVLSVGQQQRISLARAIFGAPSLLILDEPNSALDAAGEAALKQALIAERARGAAIVLVAHRRSILDLADRVMVVQSGSVSRIEDIVQSARTESHATATSCATTISPGLS
jgi:ATP-binding cassette subfamily C protein